MFSGWMRRTMSSPLMLVQSHGDATRPEVECPSCCGMLP